MKHLHNVINHGNIFTTCILQGLNYQPVVLESSQQRFSFPQFHQWCFRKQVRLAGSPNDWSRCSHPVKHICSEPLTTTLIQFSIAVEQLHWSDLITLHQNAWSENLPCSIISCVLELTNVVFSSCFCLMFVCPMLCYEVALGICPLDFNSHQPRFYTKNSGWNGNAGLNIPSWIRSWRNSSSSPSPACCHSTCWSCRRLIGFSACTWVAVWHDINSRFTMTVAHVTDCNLPAFWIWEISSFLPRGVTLLQAFSNKCIHHWIAAKKEDLHIYGSWTGAVTRLTFKCSEITRFAKVFGYAPVALRCFPPDLGSRGSQA